MQIYISKQLKLSVSYVIINEIYFAHDKNNYILTNNLKLYLYDGLMKIQRVMATKLSPHRNKKKLQKRKFHKDSLIKRS